MPFLFSYWKQIGIALVVVAIGGYISILKHEIKNRDETIASEKILNDSLTEAVERWKQASEIQNQKIDEMNKEYADMQTKVQTTQTQIKTEQIAGNQKIENLKIKFQTIPDSDDCSAVKEILDEK